MTLGMIWAQAHEGVIGRDNDLPWHLPEDLRHFRRTTAGDAVVMGRRQWESLPERIRPLPGRRNVVLSRNPDYRAPGAELVTCLADALELVGDDDAWICGGAQVYEEAIEHADLLVVTEIDHAIDGDRYGPVIGPQWQVTDQDPADGGWHVAENAMRYRILTYHRADRGRRPG